MENAPEQIEEPQNLRFLRRLVTGLTATMIVGLVVLIGLVAVRLQRPSLPMPDTITLPNGVVATAFTQTTDWFAIVTDDNQILIYDRDGGALRQTVTID